MQTHSLTSTSGNHASSCARRRGRSSSSIRLATLADQPRVTELIVSAFETDPASRWMYPSIWDYHVLLSGVCQGIRRRSICQRHSPHL